MYTYLVKIEQNYIYKDSGPQRSVLLCKVKFVE